LVFVVTAFVDILVVQHSVPNILHSFSVVNEFGGMD